MKKNYPFQNVQDMKLIPDEALRIKNAATFQEGIED